MRDEKPQHCQYVTGPCDQSFDGIRRTRAFFCYASQPVTISATIDEAVRKLKQRSDPSTYYGWRDLAITGQVIFCEICKAQRFTSVAVADVTTLNFNVLFEIGYALGLGLPVVLIRDTTCNVSTEDYRDLGLLDTLGYLDYQTSDDLVEKLPTAIAGTSFPFGQSVTRNNSSPLYYVRSAIPTDGQIRLLSAIKKSGIKFRTFDPKETSRLSLQDAYKEIKSSLGFVGHLLAEIRTGSLVHNARCALLSGLAMSSEQYVLLLQEGYAVRPLDYRDIVQAYTDPAQVQGVVTPFVKQMYDGLQTTRFVPITLPLNALEKLDLGDLAAENEINALRQYFFPTSQYVEARRGHARLVVGRKGSGKTAIFYGIRNAYWSSQEKVVLDLKPEGHQFLKLREEILLTLSKGMQEHVLTAFWTYLLQMEIANRIIETDDKIAAKSPERLRLYRDIERLRGANAALEEGDFSERLLDLVDTITIRAQAQGPISTSQDIAHMLYSHDLPNLGRALRDYLRFKDGVWLLIDNLDKGWPVDGAGTEDILILRSLLEATRKLQREYSKNKSDFNAIVFLRSDIYDHLLRETSDKGKDTAVIVEWDDEEALQQVIRRRMIASVGADGSFQELWAKYFDSHVDGEFSFSYLVRKTLMRPRDLLRLLRECVNVAVNRGHDKVFEGDIQQAEKRYSEDMLQEVSFELRDISPEYADVVYAFIGSEPYVCHMEVIRRLGESGKVQVSSIEFVSKLLLWFGFLGISKAAGEEAYAYQYQYGVERLMREASTPAVYSVHPAFRKALGISEPR